MTRFASIMGVAAVATIVLLSGCETPTTTDYAKDLAGTWTHGPAPVTLDNPLPEGQPPQIPAMRTVTATVTRTGVNKGTFAVAVSDQANAPLDVGPLAEPVEKKASGTMEVDGTEITVTISADDIMLPPGVTLTPTQVAAFAGPQKIQYDLTDNDTKLNLSGGVLVALEVTSSPTGKFMLDKQMASGS